jgi:hypothetical protein
VRLAALTMSRILLVGSDLPWLQNHRAALAKVGADMILSDPMELETHVGGERFDLVVLCHTLTDTARRAATATAHRRWPHVRVLQICADHAEMKSLDCPVDDRTAVASDEIAAHASKLLGEVGGIVSRRDRGFR